MDYITLLSGIVGLLFFEFLRIYKCTTVGKHPVPNNRIGWHVFGLSGLAVISAFLAYQFAQGQFVEGMVLGFSVPSGLKTVLAKETATPKEGDDMWKKEHENAHPGTKPAVRWGAERWVRSYFDSRP